jgi:hypothetical protein
MAKTPARIAGRESEMAVLDRALRSKEAELIAVYGNVRRRCRAIAAGSPRR